MDGVSERLSTAIGALVAAALVVGAFVLLVHVLDSGGDFWLEAIGGERALVVGQRLLVVALLIAEAAEHTYAEKMLSAMRKGFGGHLEPGKKA